MFFNQSYYSVKVGGVSKKQQKKKKKKSDKTTAMTSEASISSMKMCSDCDWWMANGDGSQKICETCHPEASSSSYNDAANEAVSTTTTPSNDTIITKRKFISVATFNKKLKLSKPGMITKWRDLPINDTFFINRIVERTVKIEGRKQTSRYLELDNIETWERKNVWITSVIDSELQTYDLKTPTYIRPLGLKTPENGRSYYNFAIVVDNDCNEE